jgi:glycosyltransferase involved in cell wall biosynthesis
VKLALITAGAAGMFCGSCMHDNTLAAALQAQGHDAVLVPTYTPIRTDETDVSQSRVFFGGINVYLQQKSWLFRVTPWLFDRLLDVPRLLRWVSRFAGRMQYHELGDLTVSMLKGSTGFQRKEVTKLVGWLGQHLQPQAILLTNVLLSGMVPELKRQLRIPIIAELQGDDIFLEAIPAAHRQECLRLIAANSAHLDGFFSTSAYYADFMAGYLGVPREQIRVVYPGLNLRGHGGPKPARSGPLTIGYFARICPEKGLHVLVDAFIHLRQRPGCPPYRLHIGGWLGENNQAFFAEQMRKLDAAGLRGDVAHLPAPDHAAKVQFFHGIDVLSVPTTYREPKGLYLLEAWANGVPVVQPRHGSFPELIAATQGGVLVEPNDPVALADGLAQLLHNEPLRTQLGTHGQAAVRERFDAASMARATVAELRRWVPEDQP